MATTLPRKRTMPGIARRRLGEILWELASQPILLWDTIDTSSRRGQMGPSMRPGTPSPIQITIALLMLRPALGRLVFQASCCLSVEALSSALKCNIIFSNFLAFVWNYMLVQSCSDWCEPVANYICTGPTRLCLNLL